MVSPTEPMLIFFSGEAPPPLSVFFVQPTVKRRTKPIIFIFFINFFLPFLLPSQFFHIGIKLRPFLPRQIRNGRHRFPWNPLRNELDEYAFAGAPRALSSPPTPRHDAYRRVL